MKMDYFLKKDGFNMWTKFVISLVNQQFRIWGHCSGGGHCY